jgi:hypothetical protein
VITVSADLIAFMSFFLNFFSSMEPSFLLVVDRILSGTVN